MPESWPGAMVAGCYRDPAYSIEHDALAGDLLIHLRDERFGWLHYIVTRDRALDFANRILAQLAAADGRAGLMRDRLRMAPPRLQLQS